jgi:hypothetical protein
VPEGAFIPDACVVVYMPVCVLHLTTQQAELQQAKAALKELQQQQEHRAQALSKLEPRSAPYTAAAGDATAAAATGHKKARTGSSSQGDDRHGSSGGNDQQQQQEDEENEELQDAYADAAAPTPAAAQGDVEIGSPAPAGATEGCESQEDMQADMQGVSTEKQHKRRSRAGSSSRQGSKAATLRRSTRARVIQDSSSSSGADDEVSSSSSEEEEEGTHVGALTTARRTRRGGAAAATAANAAEVNRGAVKQPARRKGTGVGSMQVAERDSDKGSGAAAAQQPVLSAAVLGKQTALLQQRQQQLDEQELELQQEYASVDKAALQQDLAALQGLAAAHSTLQQLQQQREAAATALEVLLDERYSRLLAVLQQLNSRLDAVYGQLTGGCGKVGDEYISDLTAYRTRQQHLEPQHIENLTCKKGLGCTPETWRIYTGTDSRLNGGLCLPTQLDLRVILKKRNAHKALVPSLHRASFLLSHHAHILLCPAVLCCTARHTAPTLLSVGCCSARE